jgi:hypothetical protein
MSPRRQPEVKPFLERFGGLTTWLVGIVAGGLINTGMMYAQFQQVLRAQAESKDELRLQASRLSEFREKQIVGLQDIQVLKGNVQTLDARVLVIERIFIEQPTKGKK